MTGECSLKAGLGERNAILVLKHCLITQVWWFEWEWSLYSHILNDCFLVDGTVWEGLKSMTLLEEVWYWGWILFASSACGTDISSQLPYLPACCNGAYNDTIEL